MRSVFKLSFASLAFAVVAVAQASPFSWIQWTSATAGVATGTITTSNGVTNATLTGQFNALVLGYPSWGPASTWADGSIIDNTVNSNGIIQMDNEATFNLHFDRPVDHFALAAWSVGSPGINVTYTFDHNLQIVAGGPSNEYGGSPLIAVGSNGFTGHEGNGSVLFNDQFTDLNWTIKGAEFWHGFSVGLKTSQLPVPEPTSMVLLATGVAALLRKRRS